MSASKSSKKARRHQPPTRDLQPRNGRAVTGGKKAASEVVVVQQQTETRLQDLQSLTK